ncbi:hypothetical protein [Roseateles microcysteis]|uniref:hypothetical protein n=1 Tax=Roseateles microcysteis TaxID=3119057 RepID=UPI002FE57606
MKSTALTLRPLALLATVAAGALLSACSISITAPANDDHNSAGRMRLSNGGSARFECVKSPTGECNYTLYTTQCQTGDGERGKPATTCTHQVVEEFTLTQGQSREVRDLPNNYKQCMKVGSKPVVPNCD